MSVCSAAAITSTIWRSREYSFGVGVFPTCAHTHTHSVTENIITRVCPCVHKCFILSIKWLLVGGSSIRVFVLTSDGDGTGDNWAKCCA